LPKGEGGSLGPVEVEEQIEFSKSKRKGQGPHKNREEKRRDEKHKPQDPKPQDPPKNHKKPPTRSHKNSKRQTNKNPPNPNPTTNKKPKNRPIFLSAERVIRTNCWKTAGTAGYDLPNKKDSVGGGSQKKDLLNPVWDSRTISSKRTLTRRSGDGLGEGETTLGRACSKSA